MVKAKTEINKIRKQRLKTELEQQSQSWFFEKRVKLTDHLNKTCLEDNINGPPKPPNLRNKK